ncbi:unnamed protein product [Closterium sp. Yama58-4]|nr:unnamed protein product [Closterium sp. Yama58-4]
MSPHTECLTVGAAANSRSPDDAACVAMPGSDSTPPATLPAGPILLRCLAAVPFPLYRSLHTVCAAWRRLADPLALHQIRRAEGMTELWRVDLENEYRDAAFQGSPAKPAAISRARSRLAVAATLAPPTLACQDQHFSLAPLLFQPLRLARQRSSSSNDMNRIDMSACAHHADAAASCGRCRTSDDASDVRVTPLAGPLRLQYGAVGNPNEPELLVVGGRSPFPVFCREVVRAYAFAHAYNALTDSWRALAPMPTARFAFGIAAWTHPSSRQTYVAVAGGYASNGEALFDAELYHVSSNTWTTLPPLTHASGACRAVVHGNRLIVAQRTGGPAESLDLAALLSTSPPALDAVAHSLLRPFLLSSLPPSLIHSSPSSLPPFSHLFLPSPIPFSPLSSPPPLSHLVLPSLIPLSLLLSLTPFSHPFLSFSHPFLPSLISSSPLSSLPPFSHPFLPSLISSSPLPSLPPLSHPLLPSLISSSLLSSLSPFSHLYLPSLIPSSLLSSLPPFSHPFLPSLISSSPLSSRPCTSIGVLSQFRGHQCVTLSYLEGARQLVHATGAPLCSTL